MSNPLTYIGNAPVFLAVKALRTVKFGVEYFTDLEPVINKKQENNECVLLLYLAYTIKALIYFRLKQEFLRKK